MQWSFVLLGACVVLVALLAAYVPTIYIRKTNKVIALLEQIAANTKK
jgi:ABC-type antimicrobial peptide transport system permease subunit